MRYLNKNCLEMNHIFLNITVNFSFFQGSAVIFISTTVPEKMKFDLHKGNYVQSTSTNIDIFCYITLEVLDDVA